MTFLFLSELFYKDYIECTQIEKKSTRPYIQVFVEVNSIPFAVPLSSNINHVLWTNKEEHCGLDFSKAVVITDKKYINTELSPHIRQDEFDALRGKEYIIKQKLLKHIRDYKKAKNKLHIKRNEFLCNFSTMQYFEEYIARVT